MMFWAMLAVTVVLAVVAATVVFVVIYTAVSNMIDWIIITFGNAEAAGELRRRRASSSRH